MDNTTTIIVAVLASSGCWAVVQSIIAYFIDKKKKKDDNGTISKQDFECLQKAVRGLLYGELENRCAHYIQQGHISTGDLNDLRKYYYEPYKGLQGDGTIDRLMSRVEDLDIIE